MSFLDSLRRFSFYFFYNERYVPKKKAEQEPIKNEAYKDYKVEYYPATGRYFAFVQGTPLRYDFDAGRVIGELTLYHATSCAGEEEAMKLIEKHHAQAARPTPPPLRYIREDGKVVK